VGRVNYSFTSRLREEVSRIRRELWELLGEDERGALERLESMWISRSHVAESLSNPYLLGSLLLLAVLDIEARLRKVEEELAKLELE